MLAPELLPSWGGAGIYTVELIRHLPKTVEVEVLTPSRKRLGKIQTSTRDYDLAEYFSDNVRVRFISSASDTFFYNAAFQRACFRFVPKLVKQESIDVIHSHTAHMPDLLLQLRRLKVANVATVHTTLAGLRRASKESGMRFRDLEFSEKATYLGYPFLMLSEKFYFYAKREYITLSNWMKAQLVTLFPKINKSKLRAVPNSVDTTFYTPAKQHEHKIVLCTSRFIAAKGVTYLLDAIPRILRIHPDVTFVFIGPGNYEPYKNKLTALNVPTRNVSFLGYISYKDRDEILEHYRRCSIFVLPSLYENVPTGVLEAMACAKAVVASNVGGIPEVITSGYDGVLVPPKSSEALSKAIIDLLQDPDLREEMGERARESVVSKFDWGANARKTLSVYEEIVAQQDEI